MQGYRLVHQDEEVEVYELDTIEVADEDILCAEPAAEMRPSVQLRYLQVNEFLGQYLGRIRRGEPMVVPAPRGVERGDLVDVEIAIAQRERISVGRSRRRSWPRCSSSPGA